MTELKSGDRFGRLVVIERAPDYVTASGKKYPQYLCRCDCGNVKTIDKRNLVKGFTQSCGCLRNERVAEVCGKHGDTDSRLYNVWCAIKRRCYNPTVPEYKNYGARGIQMCDEWKDDYGAFMKWAYDNGYQQDAPRGVCTIDRIDNTKGYSPDNCRWVSMTVPTNNLRTNHRITYNGETHTIAEWARIYQQKYRFVYQRLTRYGWDFERAFGIA